MRNRGFTIVELMVVVAIILILVAIAVPSYMNFRQTAKEGICVANLRQIESAIEQWGIINDVSDEEPLTGHVTQIYTYLHGNTNPTCPSAGTYTFRNLGDRPQVMCNVQGHVYIPQ